MVELYVSWCKGLANDKEALKILSSCPLITGVEGYNFYDEMESFKAAGLKMSVHNPIKPLGINLFDKGLTSNLKRKENQKIIQAIINSDAKVIGFHIHYTSWRLELFALQGVAFDESTLPSLPEDKLKKSMIMNLVKLEKMINQGLPDDNKKKVIFETYPYTNFNLVKERKNDVTGKHLAFLRSAGLMNMPEFLSSIFNDKRISQNPNLGFLFDVAHVFISIHNLANEGLLQESKDECIKNIIKATAGRVYQLHITGVHDLGGKVYGDKQIEIKKDPVSIYLLDMAKEILACNPVSTVTLEIETGLAPVPHAKKLVQQAEMVTKFLELKVEK
ncbi:hypothetical protein JXB28_02570 [Candidatus Woesearchaeota archaeon]|nr:hypothetical protein [Candidatus Woesearchaeota archaeon]